MGPIMFTLCNRLVYRKIDLKSRNCYDYDLLRVFNSCLKAKGIVFAFLFIFKYVMFNA